METVQLLRGSLRVDSSEVKSATDREMITVLLIYNVMQAIPNKTKLFFRIGMLLQFAHKLVARQLDVFDVVEEFGFFHLERETIKIYLQ